MPDERSFRRPGRIELWALILCLAALASTLGCRPIERLLGSKAEVSHMSAGGNVFNGNLECWLTLEFDDYPENVDLTDIKVRFESPALVQSQEFGWDFMAGRDIVDAGAKFNSGHLRNEKTQPGERPPLRVPMKVKFPLAARPSIQNAPSTIWLTANLYWGGEKQDSGRRSIEHMYSRSL